MGDITNINCGVGVSGKSNYRLRKQASLDDAIRWINSLGYEENTTKRLIQIVSKYPNGSYYQFKANLPNYLIKMQEENKKPD